MRPEAVKRVYQVPDKFFNHLDFIFAKDSDKLVYNKIVHDMKKYQ